MLGALARLFDIIASWVAPPPDNGISPGGKALDEFVKIVANGVDNRELLGIGGRFNRFAHLAAGLAQVLTRHPTARSQSVNRRIYFLSCPTPCAHIGAEIESPAAGRLKYKLHSRLNPEQPKPRRVHRLGVRDTCHRLATDRLEACRASRSRGGLKRWVCPIDVCAAAKPRFRRATARSIPFGTPPRSRSKAATAPCCRAARIP